MDTLLRVSFTTVYLDDLVIYSSTWEDHCRHLRELLQRLKVNRLTAKPSTCQFEMGQCVYLGHVVGDGQVRPEIGKIDAVMAFPVPTSKKHVRAFLGLTGYYCRIMLRWQLLSPTSLATRYTGLANAIVHSRS